MLLKSQIKSFSQLLSKTKLTISVYNSWSNRYKAVYKNPNFQLNALTHEEKEEYRNYWKVVSPHVSFKTVEVSKSLSGIFDKRIVPEEFYALYIEPILNNDRSSSFLENKSIYNKWFDASIFPKDFFHKINNNYYTHDFNRIDNIEEYIGNQINDSDFPIVIKPSKDSFGGANIYFINTVEDVKKVIKKHPNLVVQEKIKQSELINEIIKDSINTIRVCLYKDKEDKIHVLNTNIRMGKDGSLDNETAGGIVCHIDSKGTLNGYAVDKHASKYFMHPNSKYVFEGKQLPFYNDLISISKSVASKVIGARLISLDMCLDSSNNWRCIEINLFGQTIRFAQYAGHPFFGSYTEEVIKEIL